MRNTIPILITVLLLLLTFGVPARAACDEPYGICMSECATAGAPERCMQRCRQSFERCTKTGVFQMPLAYKWREPSSFSAHAETPWSNFGATRKKRKPAQ